MVDPLGDNLRRLGRHVAADAVDDAVMGPSGCIGRLFGCVLFLLLVVVVAGAVGISALVRKALPAGSELADKVLLVGAIAGFFVALVAIGILQNALRRAFWRMFISRGR